MPNGKNNPDNAFVGKGSSGNRNRRPLEKDSFIRKAPDTGDENIINPQSPNYPFYPGTKVSRYNTA